MKRKPSTNIHLSDGWAQWVRHFNISFETKQNFFALKSMHFTICLSVRTRARETKNKKNFCVSSIIHALLLLLHFSLLLSRFNFWNLLRIFCGDRKWKRRISMEKQRFYSTSINHQIGETFSTKFSNSSSQSYKTLHGYRQ